MNAKDGNSSDLEKLLAADKTQKQPARRKGPRPQHEDLDKLMGEAKKATMSRGVARGIPAEKGVADDDLHTLSTSASRAHSASSEVDISKAGHQSHVRANGGVSSHPVDNPTSTSGGRRNASLDAVLQEASTRSAEGETEEIGSSKLRVRNAAVVVICLLAIGFTYRHWHHQIGDIVAGAQRSPRQILSEIEGDLARYVRQHGMLPTTLTALDAFPRDAIEWPIEYRSVRNLEGRPELLLVPEEGGRYQIIYRDDGVVWTKSPGATATLELSF